MGEQEKLAELIRLARLTVPTAASELDIDERSLREYCDGTKPVPRVVMLAVERLYDRQLGADLVNALPARSQFAA